MSDTREYTWRSFSGLFRPSRIVFDFAARTIEFHNAIPPNGFFNLFHQKFVRCSFDEVIEVDAYTQNDTRCLSVTAQQGKCVYLDGTVPKFNEFVTDFMAACPPQADA